MKKYICTFLVIFSLSVSVHLLSGAMWIPSIGGSGDNSGPGVWKQTTTDSYQLSYEQLENLCLTANIALQGRHYLVIQSDYHDGMFCKLWEQNGKYYIRLYEYNSTVTSYYLAVDQDTVTGGRYWAYAPLDDNKNLKPLFDQIKDIRSFLSSIDTHILNLERAFLGYGSNAGYIATVTNWLSARATDISNIASRNIATYAGYEASTATWLAWTYKYVEDIRSYTSSLSTISNRLVLSVDGTDYSISNLVRQIWNSTDGVETLIDSNGIWLTNLSSASNWDTVEVTQSVANMMIAEINAGRHGNYGYFHNGTNYQYLYRPLISYASIVNGEIRVAARNSSGNNSNMRLVTPNGRRYVVVSDPAISFDTSSIVAAINKIYNWLDNADLATNQTIVNVVDQNMQSAQEGVDIASQILKLFKSVFAFNRPGPDFPSVVQYFSNLGSDPS